MQDRVGRPVSDRKQVKGISTKDFWSEAKADEGRFDSTLYVSGMTCRGCAWLIQRIASREPHVSSAAVSLVSGRLELRHAKDFDFQSFQERLSHFAYSLSNSPGLGLSLSPILVRAILSFVFSANGSLLLVADKTGIGGASLAGLLPLLALLNVLLLMFVGGAVFCRPAWDALRFRHFHGDAIPALLLISLALLSAAEILKLTSTDYFAIALFVLTPILVFARVAADFFDRRVRQGNEKD